MGKHPYFPSVKSTWRNAQEYDGLTTPSNPASSKFKLYFKSDGQLYSLNSSGTEAVVGGSLGSDIQTSEIDDNAITLDKIYHGTANKVIGFDGSGIPTELSALTASSTDTLTNKTLDADGTGNSLTNIENANIKASAGIDATKLADGTVTSTELQYINTLTSNAQTQLDTKITASSTETLTNKTLTNPTFSSFNDYARITIPSNPSTNYGRLYVKQIDASNDGIFIQIKKAGSFVEVQIA